MCRPAVAAKVVEISGNNVTHGETTASRPRPSHGTLCLAKSHNPNAIGFGKVVGEHDLALGGAQVLDRIPALTAITPRYPGSGAAGKFPVAKVQSGLNQPEIWLVRYRQPTAGGSGFEV